MSEEEKPEDPRAFRSPAEFKDLMRHLSARLGYINRVAGGEKKFYIEVSQILSNLGKGFEDYTDDKAFNAKFGDGWSKGTATREEQREILAEMLLPKDKYKS